MNNSAKRLIEEHGWEEGTAIAHVNSNCHCEYCGDDLLTSWRPYYSMQIDHLLPKHLHDGHRFNFANYVSSCPTCNHVKGRFNPLRDGEDANNMLSQNRSRLIERVCNHLDKKIAEKEHEFEVIKSIIRSADITSV